MCVCIRCLLLLILILAVKNSYDFHEFITKEKVPNGWIMISLDVVSLFTNLPKELIMDAINKRWSDIAQHTDLSREEFIEMVHRILNQTYFIFDGTIYSQIDGMPMGSPFSPIAAEITMDVLLDTVVEWAQLTMDITLTVVKKYVDDL